MKVIPSYIFTTTSFLVPVITAAMSTTKVPFATTSTVKSGSATALSSSSQQQQQQHGKMIIHWFRHGDLRLLDNPALMYSCKVASFNDPNQKNNNILLPFFCFDDTTIFGNNIYNTKFHFPYHDDDKKTNELKCSPKRAKFIMESVTDLQQNILKITNNNPYLIIGKGNPTIVLSNIVKHIQQKVPSNITYDYVIVCQQEVVQEEMDMCTNVLNAVKDAIADASTGNNQNNNNKSKVTLQQIWGSTMYELNDLPYNTNTLEDAPDVYTPFRNKVEKYCKIPRPVPVPTKQELYKSNTLPKTIQELFEQYQTIPTLAELGYTTEQIQYANTYDPRGVLNFMGGETAGLQRIQNYIWGPDDLYKTYFDTRNGMLGPNYSTKFSPWLAHGCISSRTIASECHKYEIERQISNKSTYWVIFELLWRDYCKFFTYKHRNAIFYPNGILNRKKQFQQTQQQQSLPKQHQQHNKWTYNKQYIDAWKHGQTGYPLVDANIREMIQTGFMSNRGRQNVASFLAIDLNQDWRIGGDYFESYLIDYDVYSNWVNWCFAAGMTGGRLNRFNIVKQSKDYDQHGDYVRHWLPELKHVPIEFVHEPWKMTLFQQTEYKCMLGTDYPYPIISPHSSTPSRSNDGNNNNNGRSTQKDGGGGGNASNWKQRKPYNGQNRGQKYEMKSVKTGGYDFKEY